MKAYRAVSLILAATFGLVGMLFLLLPGTVLGFFNRFADPLGLAASPVDAGGLWHALAVAYMYLVTFLAVRMARHPTERFAPLLLAHAKLASAILSLAFFIRLGYPVLASNFIVDGALGGLVLWMRSRLPR
jgi:hypothetical protein